ncbi:MAG: membrane protein insertase YidC [Anaerolineae bacterium]|nr:membrane protein insertase YidC [Anaerolineae bacterium]
MPNLGDFILNPFVTVLVILYKVLGFLPQIIPGQTVVLSIVLFTILIRLLTHPLTLQQQRSTKAMQELAPEIEKLKKKYANDREKFSQAQMELYKQAGINPLGGCLPLLIQFPIIIGLYSAIITTLGGTPIQLLQLHDRILLPGLASQIPLENQFLWLNLAQPDPTPILAVLVVVTAFFQQKLLMPAGADGAAAGMSQSMLYIMPLMYGWIAFSLAAGLSIYFITSSVIGIAQYSAMGKANWGSLLSFGRAKSSSADQPGGDEQPGKRNKRQQKKT